MKKWIIILIIVAILLVGLLVGIWVTCRDWNMLAAISTWVLAAGVGFAIWQIIITRENTRKSTSAQVAVDLFSRLREREVVYALRTIYRNEPEDLATLLDIKPKEEYKRANKEKAELEKGIECVIDNLDFIGALVSNGIIDEHMAIEAYSGTTALRCWYVLREYIVKVRLQRGGPYCKYLEDFAWRTLEHQKKVPKDERILFYKDDPNKPFDLIQDFIDNANKQPKKRT